ncbi:RNA polymerase factor sigma-54 [Microvirga lenta]|uniref:RNA polymerase factor sigma-54 n=1 Tax=Microvirga lenta TaxID=2881337 RepID=UPI001CFFCB36|nr:RNA polymerase factor sigma-54 [Microvirga lenta]MCB5174832.1 RNA polymerase factor sigma-54 [Microvirga lenta]
MSATQRLELRQGQSLTMTPQLLQSIKLLQLSHAELVAYVEAELERNPLLQEAEGGAFPRSPARQAPNARRGGGIGSAPRPLPVPKGPSSGGSVRTGGGDSELKPELEATLARAASLTEHLEAQLDLAGADREIRQVGEHLIHSLDESGYLTEDLADIAGRLAVSTETVEAALRLIQGFDPPGVGARNLAECLALQLRERDRLDPAMETLLGRLDLVARHDFAALRRLCGVDAEDLADMLAELRRLEPKPGLAFAAASVDVLVPDALVRAAPGGGFTVELNPDTLPRILLDRTYHAQVVQSVKSDKDKVFLSECLQNAHWLTRSLDQRARTILKVATEIVTRQEAFFREGVAALRPLTLKAVAEAIGMHESTVSRVAANKAIGSARGVFPMKSFFAAAAGEGGHSSEAVRYRIRQLVEAEAPDAVLSDDAIAQKLKGEGMEIARRTVAKYREILRIPSSADRRRRAKHRLKTP